MSTQATGLPALASALGVTLGLMAAIFILSRIFLRFGLLPLSAAISFSGFNTGLFYVLILPGTVVHELSHYLACLLTGVRVQDVALFSPQQDGAVGWVVHDKADPLRRNIIALAPFFGGSLAVYALMRLLLPASQIDPLTIVPNDLAQSFSTAFAAVRETLGATDLRRWTTWLAFYVLFSLGFSIAPSREDLGHLLTDGAAALVFVLLIRIIDLEFGLELSRSPSINNLAATLASGVQRFNALLLFACAFVALGTLVTIPVAFVVGLLRGGVAYST